MNSRSITYKSVPVKNVSLRFLKNVSQRSTIHVGIDIGKHKLYVVVRWTPPRSQSVIYENPWLVKSPSEIPLLINKLVKLTKKNKIVIGIESTGTYGDPLRQAMADADLVVHQVRCKLTHDYAEIFDGVPSQHDGKDAAVIAELIAQGKSRPWPFLPLQETDGEIQYQVKRMLESGRDFERHRGKLEGLIAKHWPELTSLIALASPLMLRLLKHYGSPAELCQDKDIMARINSFSYGLLSEEKARQVVRSAKTTQGVRVSAWDAQWIKDLCTEMHEFHRVGRQCRRRLKELVAVSSTTLQRLSDILGVGTASVVWARMGDPKKYHCAEAWLKAMGLNLTERSSGEFQSEVHISKRGDPVVRHWLYMATLRWVQKSPVKEWFQRKKSQTGCRLPNGKQSGSKAATAVLRKLVKGLYHSLIHDVPFDPRKLFFKESSKKKDRSPGLTGVKRKRPRTKKSSKSVSASQK